MAQIRQDFMLSQSIFDVRNSFLYELLDFSEYKAQGEARF